jgi:hybrid polyketide synthase/nonribosomal peptide synthetase ACE1
MFSSYNYTDISSGFFEAAQERFKDYSDRMIYKTFDMEQPPASQGFVEESYDIVLASNVLHATDKLEEMMAHSRQLLKPGGYLIVLELTSNDSMRIRLPMGPLPGWWVGAETGRPMGPTVTLPKWDALLRRHGFGGIDTSTPILHKLHVSTVFVAQAIDDRISLLRSPLSSMNTLPSTEAPRLVIVGGETLTTYRITEQAAAVLAPRFSSIERIASFDELEDDMPYSSTVLSLTEPDDPLFKNITPRKLIALKTLWRQGGNILWVTRGARSDEPFSAMSHGLGRAMIHEYPNITLQVLDLDRLGDEETTTRLLVEELLRLEILKKWKGEGQGGEFLWSIEPEVCMQSGIRTIPRLYKCEDANKRYNSHRRTVTKAVNVQEHPILFASEGSTYELEDPSPLHLTPHIPSKSRTVQISHFLLQTIEVASYGKLMLFVGTDHNTADRVLGLSPVTESRPTVPADWTVAIGENDPAKLMVLVAAHITTSRILKLVPSGSIALVHEPDLLVGAALTQQSKDLNVRVVITTALKSQVRSGWQYVSENLPRRLVKKLLSNSVTAFVKLSQAPGSARAGELLRDCAPRSCIKFDSEDFYGTSTELKSRSSPSEASEVLKSAWLASAELLSQIENPSVVSLQALPKLSIAEIPLTIVDCMASTVEVSVQAIDSGVIFRADRTYFLVGMSGQVGQSLCQWMVGHGAKYVVLTSRRPKVHPEFIKSMEAMDSTVKILAL